MSTESNQEDQSAPSPTSPRTESIDQVQEHQELQSGDDQETETNDQIKNKATNAVDLDSETDELPVDIKSLPCTTYAMRDYPYEYPDESNGNDANEHDAASTDTASNDTAFDDLMNMNMNESGSDHTEFNSKPCCITLATMAAVAVAREAIGSGHTVISRDPAADLVYIDEQEFVDLTVGAAEVAADGSESDVVAEETKEDEAAQKLSAVEERLSLVEEKLSLVEQKLSEAERVAAAAQEKMQKDNDELKASWAPIKEILDAFDTLSRHRFWGI